MLGRAWTALLAARGYTATALGRQVCDLCKRQDIHAAVDGSHACVINCAAFSDVDAAESDFEQADLVNGQGVGVLARRCAQVATLLVHFSTDYVFNGRAQMPYSTDQYLDPVNAYGRSKANGERLLRSSSCRFLLVRTSWLYAPWAKNFVRTIAQMAERGQTMRIVDDQKGRPTSAEHLARSTLTLIERGDTATWHVTDGGACTWYELACQIVRRVNPQCPVEPCNSHHFARPAKRPSYSVLNITQTEAAIGPMRPWQENLAAVLDRLGSMQ